MVIKAHVRKKKKENCKRSHTHKPPTLAGSVARLPVSITASHKKKKAVRTLQSLQQQTAFYLYFNRKRVEISDGGLDGGKASPLPLPLGSEIYTPAVDTLRSGMGHKATLSGRTHYQYPHPPPPPLLNHGNHIT